MGLPFVLERLQQVFVVLPVFIGEDEGFGEEAVAEIVEAEVGLALGGLRAGRFFGVRLVGGDLFCGSHIFCRFKANSGFRISGRPFCARSPGAALRERNPKPG